MIKKILKLIVRSFLASYLFWMVLFGWLYMLHAISPNLYSGSQMTYGPDELSAWILIMAFTTFILGMIPTSIWPIFNFGKENVSSFGETAWSKRWKIFAINTTIPYAFFLLFLALVGIGALEKIIGQPGFDHFVEDFSQISIFVIPFYLASGIFNTITIYLLSKFDKRITNLRFVFWFVVCFSALSVLIEPLLFIPVIFFSVLLGLTIFFVNSFKSK